MRTSGLVRGESRHKTSQNITSAKPPRRCRALVKINLTVVNWTYGQPLLFLSSFFLNAGLMAGQRRLVADSARFSRKVGLKL